MSILRLKILEKIASITERKTLFKGDFTEVKQVTNKGLGIKNHTYLHEANSQGKKVAILPYRYDKNGNLEYLFRQEIVSAWGTEPKLCAITGGINKEDGDAASGAVRELREEAGYNIKKDSLLFLGKSKDSKSTDTDYWLFAVDVTDRDHKKPSGDGTKIEQSAKNIWVKNPDTADPLTASMAVKLLNKMGE